MSMFSRLTRSHLSFLVAFSSLAGYLLFPAEPNAVTVLLLCVGIWFLAAGGSALNQVQEKDVDARMLRTRKRPLATGYLGIRTGILISVLLITAGLFALLLLGNRKVFLLGIFAIIWYNGVYTNLKRLTPFAVLPGSLCGAIPPVIGWLLAGGSAFDYRIMLLAGTIVLWQVPHFWLLALSYPEDARRSGLPNLFSRIRPEKLRRLILIWIIALLAGVATGNLFGLLRADAIRIGLMTATLLFAGILLRYVRCRPEPTASSKLFVMLNIFMTLWFGGIAIDRYAVETNQFVIHILTFFG